MIIKIMTFDDQGNSLGPVMPHELEKNYPKIYKNLIKATRKMGKYLEETIKF